jgi:predicted transcriptional regulator
LSLKDPLSHYRKLASTLDVLCDVETLKILDEAKKGFKSGRATIAKLNLNPRKYYRNLRKLNDTGIIMLTQDKYRLTNLGENLHKMLLGDMSNLLFTNQNFPELIQKTGGVSELTVIDNYKNLINMLVNIIEKSKNEILLATRYLDLAVIQSMVFALDRNVKLKTITSEKIDFATFIKQLGSLVRNIRPNLMRFSIGTINNYRSGNVPLSFMVVDQEITIFEIPNTQFKMAFVSTDKKTVKIIAGLFEELWNKAPKLHIPTM